MGKGRDGTVPRFFDPVPLVPRNNHAGESRENSSRSRSSRRLLSRYRSHGTQKAPEQIGTCVSWDSPASPDIYKLNYIKTKKKRTVPQIFVPFPTVPWLWVPVPGICGTGIGIPTNPRSTAIIYMDILNVLWVIPINSFWVSYRRPLISYHNMELLFFIKQGHCVSNVIRQIKKFQYFYVEMAIM